MMQFLISFHMSMIFSQKLFTPVLTCTYVASTIVTN